VQQRLRDIVIARLSREYSPVVPLNDMATAHEEIGTIVEARVNFIYLDKVDSQPNPKLRLSLVGDMPNAVRALPSDIGGWFGVNVDSPEAHPSDTTENARSRWMAHRA